MKINDAEIRCSLQVASLGNITNSLRAMNVKLLENVLEVYFYYDKPPSEEEIELSEIIASEVISDFVNLSVHVIREVLPHNQPVPERGLRVFHRYER